MGQRLSPTGHTGLNNGGGLLDGTETTSPEPTRGVTQRKATTAPQNLPGTISLRATDRDDSPARGRAEVEEVGAMSRTRVQCARTES